MTLLSKPSLLKFSLHFTCSTFPFSSLATPQQQLWVHIPPPTDGPLKAGIPWGSVLVYIIFALSFYRSWHNECFKNHLFINNFQIYDSCPNLSLNLASHQHFYFDISKIPPICTSQTLLIITTTAPHPKPHHFLVFHIQGNGITKLLAAQVRNLVAFLSLNSDIVIQRQLFFFLPP